MLPFLQCNTLQPIDDISWPISVCRLFCLPVCMYVSLYLISICFCATDDSDVPSNKKGNARENIHISGKRNTEENVPNYGKQNAGENVPSNGNPNAAEKVPSNGKPNAGQHVPTNEKLDVVV